MRALEDALLEIEAALSGTANRVMTTYVDDVSYAARPAIGERIQQLREEICAVKDRYGLAAEVVSNRRRLTTKISLLSIDLTEATSEYLRAYGEVPKDEQATLDQQITKMVNVLNELNGLLLLAASR